MIIDLPNTSTSALTKKLVQIRNDSGAMALGRVLTLIIVVDEDRAEEAIESAIEASHMHPCRVVALVHGNRRGSSRVDGQIRIGGDAGASEVVVMRLYGEVNGHGEALVLPLLLPDSPVVGWWPCDAPTDLASDPVGAMCQRRINDSAVAKNPHAELKRRAKNYAPGDTDLAWSRITLWRALLAAALDQRPYEPVTGAVVVGGIDSSATDLLAGWLAEALDVPVTRGRSPQGSGLISVRLDRPSGPLDLVRPEGTTIATLSHPDQPVRRVGLTRRSDADCLTDELRRLDPDEVYELALVEGLRRVTDRSSLASALVRAGKAPSPDEARLMARRAGERSRQTSSDMVTVDTERDQVVATDKATDSEVGHRAEGQKRIGSRVSDGPTVGQGRAPAAEASSTQEPAAKKTSGSKATTKKSSTKKSTGKKASS
ncbi:glucose-6-phosphate dehydrogenase assembly protein OpcA [Arsenicicoccus bolidensis]|uniref:Glucose-6-phosphate dehydrogenase assembly protein OpcA n=1 Tax=Arsenicicoccus bolidensis TaxID=229480 RepID=A0ABS9Q413_9MICO|nr:glucose-6-phosphate dehydrogenase assembly protein OpcA [Arsenicicoccus bolidensis]MCG7322613.1 glucose-6-phosphate dehydrogenase assembly protein OpcA [Arsenicicoccus bolidensis]